MSTKFLYSYLTFENEENTGDLGDGNNNDWLKGVTSEGEQWQ